jgi:multicomponent Na+:H+ antiporter subunit F
VLLALGTDRLVFRFYRVKKSATIVLVMASVGVMFIYNGMVRIIIGPTLPDRVLALDALTTVALGFVCVIAVRTGLMLYLDIAIALALLGFLATVALARYVLARAAGDGANAVSASRETRQ